ncbi:hypothetical protein OIK40_14650 [Erythrobacter sp. sf7]|uniref:Uncharacterized protein n=1 Tax=Erythrobacter fulvus TaxID=2987523 RepID=A0ABT5JTR7_9SPHN|nr:hypothetical protein [Erythrobacter fulvus]MDC8755886.1 hypothetical protein [Erythrobacter fulvus]
MPIDLGPDAAAGTPPQSIDLTTPSPAPADPEAEKECVVQRDAGIVAGEIVVCRSTGELSDGAWDQDDFLRRYAEVTQGTKAPDVDGTGLPFGMYPYIDIRGCFIPPCPAQPALMIDVTALPEAPPGSDADRIGRGLPPLGSAGAGRSVQASAE